MKITELGEFEFIKRIAKYFKKIPANIIGIGDDCAVIDYDKSSCMLVTTDMLVEDVHFIKNKINPFDLGKKSIAVNISDIAAMGGKPHYTFISFGIPSDTDIEWLDNFYNGMKKMIEGYDIFLLGGDTTKSPEKLIINIVIVGFVEKKFLKLRSGAKIGDAVCVTGFLGDSAAGLKLLLNNKETLDQDEAYLVNWHNCPVPHLEEGMWLARFDSVNSMMDVSDGIDSDIKRIMEMSNCSAEIYLNALPLSPQFNRICDRYNWNKYELAATGGEDYCLLVTIDFNHFNEIADKFTRKFSRQLVMIGKILDSKSSFSYYLRGEKTSIKSIGYDHFLVK
ncbi:MAG: Thiamine-monophosphate kinase [Ignavibacteriae bacterium]|nr:MAG: Thiamine-monophosphate kinase [Ignavibacteriota bacterium]